MFDGGMGWKGVFQVFSAHVGSVILIIHHHPGVALSRDFLFPQNFSLVTSSIQNHMSQTISKSLQKYGRFWLFNRML